MIIGFQVGLLILAVMALFTGKLTLRKGRVLVGPAVRIAGVVFLLPWPLCFAAGVVLGAMKAMQGQRFDPAQMQGTLILTELTITLGCALLGIGIAWGAGSPQPQNKPVKEGVEAAGTRRQMPGQPASSATSEAVPWAEPVAQPQEGIVPSPPTAQPVTIQADLAPQRLSASHPRQIARLQPLAGEWLVVGIAGCCLLLLLAGTVLVWWQQSSGIKQPAVARQHRQRAIPPAKADQTRPEPPPKPLQPAPEVKKGDPRLRFQPYNATNVPIVMKLSPDGRTLATAYEDKYLTLDDVGALSIFGLGLGHHCDDTKQVVCLAFSPDARWLATCDGGSLVRLRQASTGKQYTSFPAGPNVRVMHVAFAPDNKTLLIVARHSVKLRDIHSGKERDLVVGGSGEQPITFSTGCFSSDGRRLFLFAHRKSACGRERADGVRTGRSRSGTRPRARPWPLSKVTPMRLWRWRMRRRAGCLPA